MLQSQLPGRNLLPRNRRSHTLNCPVCFHVSLESVLSLPILTSVTSFTSFSSSLDHFGYPEIRRLRIRRLLQNIYCHRAWHHNVFAQRSVRRLVVRQHLCHRLHIRCIQFVQFPYVFQNRINLGAVHLQLRFTQIEISQFRHPQHIFPADFHVG